MRCPRCSYDSPDSPRTCARCGMALTDLGEGPPQQQQQPAGWAPASGSQAAPQPSSYAAAGGGGGGGGGAPDQVGESPEPTREMSKPPTSTGQPGPVGPAWSRPPAGPNESPPWSGSQDAAPWQTPPQHAGAANWTTKVPTERPPTGIPAQPARPEPSYPWALWRILIVALPVAGVLAALYGLFAVMPRRGIFAELDTMPANVTRSAASVSDTINLVLFIAAGAALVAAAVLLVTWLVRARRSAAGVSTGLGLVWRLVGGVGVALVVVALVLHMTTSASQIALGYVVMGVGAFLLALAAFWAVTGVRQSGREAALVVTRPAVPDPPRPHDPTR
jgi:hypothetical protein